MVKFEVGKQYYMRSACDYDCIWQYEVISRTEKTITIKQLNRQTAEPIKRKIQVDSDHEYVMPLGSYSMAPSLCSDREIRPEPEQKAEPEPMKPQSNVIDFTARLKAK